MFLRDISIFPFFKNTFCFIFGSKRSKSQLVVPCKTYLESKSK